MNEDYEASSDMQLNLKANRKLPTRAPHTRTIQCTAVHAAPFANAQIPRSLSCHLRSVCPWPGSSDRHLHFDLLVRSVAHNLKVLDGKRVNVLFGGVNLERLRGTTQVWMFRGGQAGVDVRGPP